MLGVLSNLFGSFLVAISLVTRSQWGARAPKGSYSPLTSTKGVKVHYTGGRVPPEIVNDHNLCIAQVRSIQNFHMDGNGWIDIGYCVDEQTEILTRDGWKSYREIQPGDLTLTLNHETGLSEWQPLLDVYVFPAQSRTMIRMEGDRHSSLTTPQHRWPVERYRRRTGTVRVKDDRGRWVATGRSRREVTSRERLWATTETLTYWDRIPIAAPCADLPTEAKWSDAFVELVAWFWTEGTIKRSRDKTPSTSVAIYQAVKNAANVSRLRMALTEVFGPDSGAFPRLGRNTDGVPRWREALNDDLVEFHLSADAGPHLLDVAPDRVPTHEFLLSLTKAQLGLFIETSLAADNAGEDKLAQKNRAASEAFMFAVLLSGRSASLRRRPPTASCKTDMWQVAIRRQEFFGPRAARQSKGEFQISEEIYDGEIWCPRTENQSWLARRNGSVYFTGNSMIACPHRKVFVGRGPDRLPAANGSGLNSDHYAVLGLVGNAGFVKPTNDLLHGILDAIDYLRQEGGAGTEIKGHRDGFSTDCPGAALYAWVERGAPRPGGGTPGTPPGGQIPAWPGRLFTFPPVTVGDDVKRWQQQMKKIGFELEADGAYGQRSRDVCKTFQRRVDLPDDGIVGRRTWEESFRYTL
uniref:peptidoglycan-binding protein n=1 Tax=Herbidospora sakaeratensis TaxID=564415 RepID=UPI0007806FEC|nr:peptidoglycan-binding protein [Herbidospora sakaeratensis]